MTASTPGWVWWSVLAAGVIVLGGLAVYASVASFLQVGTPQVG